jgi:hypothetical protein
MVAREQLERDQRRAPARGALVFDAAPEELGLLAKAELADRPVGDRAFPVVARARRALDLVLPFRSKPRELLLASLLGQGGGLRSR